MSHVRAARFAALFGLLSLATAARAEKPPVETRVRVGAPARLVPLTVQVDRTSTTLTLGAARHTLAVRDVSDVQGETVEVGPGANVVVLRLTTAQGPWLALLGGRAGTQLLASGRGDLHGDPGERRGLAIEVDVEVDPKRGSRRVTVGTRHEALSLCDRSALLDVRAVDPETLRLRPAEAALAAELARGAERLEMTSAPSDERPLVPALSALGSSLIDAATGQPVVPRALVDGDLATVWAAPPGSFALFRGALKGLKVERIDLSLAPAAAGQRPRELLWLGEGGLALRTVVPPEGDRVSLRVPKPVPAECLALVVLSGSASETRPVVLREVTVFTDVDGQGGVAALVSQLVQDGDAAARASDLLLSLGAPAARALSARYEELSERGKRRSLRVFARALDDGAVYARVLEAARGQNAALSEAAVATLSGAGASGTNALRELSRDATPQGDAAAKALAKTRDVSALLTALEPPGNAGRPALRRALGSLAKREPMRFREAAETWLAHSPPVSARAGLALALSQVDALLELGTRVTARVALDAQSFEDRYRVASAAEHAGPSAELDTWLEAQAMGAEEWMMRRAAFAALKARSAARATGLSVRLAADPSPRVRVAALSALAGGPERARVERAARADDWPVVRVAAVRALAPHAGSSGTLRRALEDPSWSVRAAAIDALAGQPDAGAWRAVRTHLEAPGEWPAVHASAIRFAARQCRGEAREDLLQVARRALRADANEDARSLGLEALRALHELGGAAGEDARKIALREGAPAGLRAAYERFPEATCPTKRAR